MNTQQWQWRAMYGLYVCLLKDQHQQPFAMLCFDVIHISSTSFSLALCLCLCTSISRVQSFVPIRFISIPSVRFCSVSWRCRCRRHHRSRLPLFRWVERMIMCHIIIHWSMCGLWSVCDYIIRFNCIMYKCLLCFALVDARTSFIQCSTHTHIHAHSCTRFLVLWLASLMKRIARDIVCTRNVVRREKPLNLIYLVIHLLMRISLE